MMRFRSSRDYAPTPHCPSSPCRDLLPVKDGEKDAVIDCIANCLRRRKDTFAKASVPSPRVRGEGPGRGDEGLRGGAASSLDMRNPLQTRFLRATLPFGPGH